MDIIPYSTARAHLARIMDRVCDHEPTIIMRPGQRAVVMIALDDFSAMEETAYLMQSAKNAKRLLESMATLEADKR